MPANQPRGKGGRFAPKATPEAPKAVEAPIDGTCAAVREDLLPLPAVSQPMPSTTAPMPVDHAAQVQSLGMAQTENPRLREALSLVSQHQRTIEQLRSERVKLQEDVAKAQAGERTLQNTLDQSRKITQEREALLRRIGDTCGGGLNLTPEFSRIPNAVLHLRQRADRALELEEQASGMNTRAAELEIELTKRGNDLSEARAQLATKDSEMQKLAAIGLSRGTEITNHRIEIDALEKKVAKMYADIEPLAAYWKKCDPDAHFDNPPKLDFLTKITLRRLERWENLAKERQEAIEVIKEELRELANSSTEVLGKEVDALTIEASQVPTLRAGLALCAIALIPTLGYCLLHWLGGVR